MSATSIHTPHVSGAQHDRSATLSAVLVPLARVLLSAIFIEAGPNHFSANAIGYARSAGVPFAEVLVPASGILALLGGLSVLMGWRARLGAAMLVLFLVPVTLTMHAFWKVSDPMMSQMQLAMFMKNLGLLGGALLVVHFGAGPFSLDARRSPRA
jgi:putative oxidoreductase